MSGQLTLFALGSDARPLPLIVAEKWAFELRSTEQDGQEYFCTRDWIMGLQRCDEKAATMVMRYYANENDVYSSTIHIKANRLRYDTAETLYRITQGMRDLDGTAVGAIKDYLAKAGAWVDAARRDPSLALEAGVQGYLAQGKDPEWIAKRVEGKVKRTALTAALHDTVRNPRYPEATNLTYQGLCDMTAQQLRVALGLKAKANVRDHMGAEALAYIGVAETVIAAKLRSLPEVITWGQAADIIAEFATMIGRQAQETSKALGRNVFTDQVLIGGR